ncbi:helix-turn-helix domain-containing protein [Haliea sp.]|jgi:AraC-like DNA-binding protein|uniref:helix-turn-helix domain-containing protein n=1 Tax=Haliea TaxID=475794 RepID=UPI000C43855A|nr:helix-turn-helix domain-containing protein [Haliea sp.]HCD55531.1 AraC family transcriptional regulator [Halieaceae bacterium]MAD63797.1 AraC family transcriptional regulator [Haliea sp.]MAY92158.1 AraC family transcriptional regulator [Haliea sp.]MBK42082.1 AraC family transcriptional regulator [Haliea sp.]MBP69858.1 AraC family transcriptional regulator [Haliea sp.]|tara:strand:+ start:8623 stop:9579 length:957 start_codon:yes stop_codon:yes gene_type:complete
MVTPRLTIWNSKNFSPASRYEAWSETLNGSYGSWSVDKPKAREFSASLETTHIGSVTMHECICDPCKADRSTWNINQDEDFFAIQLVKDGKEQMCFDGESYVLGPGDVFVWDSTRPMTFDVIERLHKVSLILPLDRLRDWAPINWRSIPKKLSSGSANHILLRSLIRGMAADEFSHARVDENAVAEVLIAALASGLDTNRGEPGAASIRREQLARLRDYIGRNLHDPKLDIKRIAEANRISVRYLHWVFEQSGDSASNFIIAKRLASCRKDLLNPAMHSRSIAEIAYSSGFNNTSHFTRRYRQLYGETPSATRGSQRT